MAIALEREALRWDGEDPPKARSLMIEASMRYLAAANGFERQGRQAEAHEASQGMERATLFQPRPVPNPAEVYGG